ncbi:MAG: ABC transporter permease [Proteobacteria bacterium]|nr:ABC transporter permease [Pseudomonadota bacterium]
MTGKKLCISIVKELLLLVRDRAGLALLFVMPAFLVIVITLIQDKVTTTIVDVLFVDVDRGAVGAEIRSLFDRIDTIRLIETLEGEQLSTDKAKALVAASKFQFAVILPQGLSSATTEGARLTAIKNLFPDRQASAVPTVPEILVWFDPTVHGSFRAAVRSALNQVVMGVQTRLLVEKSLVLLPEKISADLPAAMRQAVSFPDLSAKVLLPQLFQDTHLIPVREHFSTTMGFIKQPTAVQQNVPAWAIFGIFFIVVPLAGSFIKERESGTLMRLKVLPVSYFTVISGKIIAYMVVCLIQFVVIVMAGMFVLPAFGLAAFEPGSQPLLFAIMMISVIAAACGYGILLGTIGRTYEQIAVFGPVSIVIGAALGGIMVPIYALPDFMRPVCLLSPLYWGQSGFYDLLLRGGDLRSILPEASALLMFGLACTVAAYLFSVGKKRHA